MENFRILFAAIAAFTLVLSAVSSVNANYFASLNAYAEDGKNDNTSGSNVNQKDHADQHRAETSSKVVVERVADGVKIEAELRGLNMTDGTYNATLTCEKPSFNTTIENALKVNDGRGKFRAEIGLENNTFSGCEILVAGTNTVIASFDSLKGPGQAQSDDDVKEKRVEKVQRLVTTVQAKEVHQRHLNANPSSPGDFKPDSKFALTATGNATNNGTKTNSALDLQFAVWKSNRALVLLDVINGTVEIGNDTYAIKIGYGIYSLNHDATKMVLFGIDEAGNIIKVTLRGTGDSTQAASLVQSGSMNMTLEGRANSWNNAHGDWKLHLDGKVTT